ncbi:MAG TPA: M23 family metallopeptidase, partial [Bacteroidota bacterium]|nr:M23 family metallopeptidase [Bacteroidota bacterium]
PIPHPELELTYGRQINGIQGQLLTLVKEVVSLRSYNIRLRRAMGENVPLADSVFLLEHPEATPNGSERRWELTGGGSGNESDSAFMEASTREFVANRTRSVSSLAENLPMSFPIRGYNTRGFDPEKNHFGIDIAAPEGTPVYAAAGGRVIFAAWTYDNGYAIIVAHDKGFMTVYKHNQQLMKNVGDEVKRDEPIALSGNTGENSTAPHVHFEVWKDGVAQDPMKYLLTMH